MCLCMIMSILEASGKNKHEKKERTINEVDLLDASGSSITLNMFDALDTLGQELWNQIVRVDDGGLEEP